VEFQIDQQIATSRPETEARLLDPPFVAATSALPKLSDCQVLDKHVEGRRVRLQIHRRFDDRLNAAVTAVIDPAKLTWVEEVVYDLDRHQGSHTIRPDHYADRLTGSYTTTIEETPDGCRRIASGHIRVRVLFGAGPVERAIVSGLREYAEAEAELLATWSPD
jgi:hypothetical protein